MASISRRQRKTVLLPLHWSPHSGERSYERKEENDEQVPKGETWDERIACFWVLVRNVFGSKSRDGRKADLEVYNFFVPFSETVEPCSRMRWNGYLATNYRMQLDAGREEP